MGRHVSDAGHLHGAAGGRGAGGRARHRGAHPRAAGALHPDARPVRLLPPGAHRVRGQYLHTASMSTPLTADTNDYQLRTPVTVAAFTF